MNQTEPIRILIADDHTLFRDGLRALLNSVPDTEVDGEAATGDEAIAQAAALQPDVVLMDIQMPGVNGIEATRRILRTSPHIGVIVVTLFEDDDSVFAAQAAGLDGIDVIRSSGEFDIVYVAARVEVVRLGHTIGADGASDRRCLGHRQVQNGHGAGGLAPLLWPLYQLNRLSAPDCGPSSWAASMPAMCKSRACPLICRAVRTTLGEAVTHRSTLCC
ncbi:MAG: response regulator transcription factor, partial [Anaerolineae bacterium]